MNLLQQLSLCCPCGSPDLYRRGLCERRYNRRRRDRDRARFAGRREQILARDRRLCCACRAPASLVVRHSSLRRKKSNLHFSPRGEAK